MRRLPLDSFLGLRRSFIGDDRFWFRFLFRRVAS
jgi:hypothetical protein